MLNLLTLPTQPATSHCLNNALTAWRLNDNIQLAKDSELALTIARSVRDNHAQGVALVALGIATQNTAQVDAAVRTLERSFLYFDAAVALCVRAAMEQVQSTIVALLNKALDCLMRAKRRIAQTGDVEQWGVACDLESAVKVGIEQGIDGSRWLGCE